MSVGVIYMLHANNTLSVYRVPRMTRLFKPWPACVYVNYHLTVDEALHVSGRVLQGQAQRGEDHAATSSSTPWRSSTF